MKGARAVTPASSEARERPAYPLAEAARYLRLPPATLRAWTAGRSYPRTAGRGVSPALIHIPDRRQGLLSFSNLVEAHVLRALRTKHGVSVKAVRTALTYAERELDVERLLLSPLLRAAGGELLLDKYGQLISLSESGQLVMRKILEAYLQRIEWDHDDMPRRLYPILQAPVLEDRRTIAIDPRISFGRPVVLRQGVSTAIIASRLLAGESAEELARDYDLNREEVEDAAIYELAA